MTNLLPHNNSYSEQNIELQSLENCPLPSKWIKSHYIIICCYWSINIEDEEGPVCVKPNLIDSCTRGKANDKTRYLLWRSAVSLGILCLFFFFIILRVVRKLIAQTLENCFSHQLVKKANYVKQRNGHCQAQRIICVRVFIFQFSPNPIWVKERGSPVEHHDITEEGREGEGDVEFRGLK